MKPCPYCAELIQDQAAKCRYCGEWLDPSKRPVWSGAAQTADAVPVAAAAPAPTPAPAPAPSPAEPILADAPPEEDEPKPGSTTLTVGSGGLQDFSQQPHEPERTWSAPAWLSNAQAARPEPEPAAPKDSVPPTDHATLEEVALRMERIRQSAAAVRHSGDAHQEAPAPTRAPAPPQQQRARLEVEPGVTLPAGSLRSVDLEGPDTDRLPAREARAMPRAPQPAPVIYDDEPIEEPPPRRTRAQRQPPEPRAERPIVDDAPRQRSRVDTPPAPDRPARRAHPEPEPEPELDEIPQRSRRKATTAPAPAPVDDDWGDEDDDFEDDMPPPRMGGDAGFDDGFMDGDDDDFDEDDDFEDGDFDDMGSAPSPLPWKAIGAGALVVTLAAVFFLRDSIFPSDPEEDAAADAADSDGAEAEAEGDDAAAAAEPAPETKAEGEGKPVEPEAGGAEAGAADGGAAAAPPKPAGPLDPATLALLEEARAEYVSALGNPKKQAPVAEKLQAVLAKAPDHPEALTLMAQTYLDQEKIDEAASTSKRCLEVSPQSADCWLTLGVISEMKEEKEQALTAYNKYMELSPEGRYAKEVQASLKRLN